MSEPIPVYTVYGNGPSLPPIATTEWSALTVPAFFSGVRFLCETLAKLPRQVVKRTAGVCLPQETHPITKLLSRKTSPFTTAFMVFENWFQHAILMGNGYIFIRRDKMGKPKALVNLDPLTVTPFRIIGGQYEGQYYHLSNPLFSGGSTVIPGDDVLHLAGLGYDGLLGYPVIDIMRDTLEHARNARKFGERYLKKGTQVQGTIECPATMTPEQIDHMLRLIKERHSGIDADYNHMILPGGATMKNGTIPPESSQLLETMQFSVLDFCRILRVPPHIVYDLTQAKWANIEQMSLDTVKYSLGGWVEKIEEELELKLLSESETDNGLQIEMSFEALLRGDSQTVSQTTLAEVNAGVRTANEGRARLGLPPDPDPASDRLRIPVNSQKTDASKPTDQPAPSSPPATPPPPNRKNAAYASLQPVLEAAIKRVEAKTEKAFATHARKSPPEMTIWANVFAEEQARYVAETIEPVAKAIEELADLEIDASAIAQQYAAAIRRRVATGKGESLAMIIEESLKGPDHGKIAA